MSYTDEKRVSRFEHRKNIEAAGEIIDKAREAYLSYLRIKCEYRGYAKQR